MKTIANILLAVTLVAAPVATWSADAFAQSTAGRGGNGGGSSGHNPFEQTRCTPSMVAGTADCRLAAETDCSCRGYVVQARNGTLQRREQCHAFVGDRMLLKIREVRSCENPHVRY